MFSDPKVGHDALSGRTRREFSMQPAEIKQEETVNESQISVSISVSPTPQLSQCADNAHVAGEHDGSCS